MIVVVVVDEHIHFRTMNILGAFLLSLLLFFPFGFDTISGNHFEAGS